MAEIADSFNSPEAFTSGATEVVRNFGDALVQLVPDFIAAVVIFVIGYALALVVSRVFKGVLEAAKFEKFLADHRMANALGNVKITNFFVKVAKYYIVLVFFQAAVSKLALGTLTDFISLVLLYAPAFVGASVLIVVSAMVGELVKEKVKEVDQKSRWVVLVARGSKFLVVFVGLVMGLSTVGFNTLILKDAFITMLQALSYGIALAIGIAFGLGGQEEAKSILADVKRKINK